MFEHILSLLPETVRAARLLYDPANGGYHLPHRDHQRPFGLVDVSVMRAAHRTPQYDCIEVPVADLLCSLVVNTRSRLILETGTSRGFSTAHLAAAARCVHGSAARVVTLDPADVPARFFRDSELMGSIDELRVDSLSQDPKVLGQGQDFDFLFLDSLHSFEHLGREIELFLPHLRLGGLMALHDTIYFDGLGLVTLLLMQVPGLEVLTTPTHRLHLGGTRSPGVTLFRKVAPIAPGAVRFPRIEGELATELVSIKDNDAVIAALGMQCLRPPYAAQNLAADRQRSPSSPGLVEPVPPTASVNVTPDSGAGAAVPAQAAPRRVSEQRRDAMAAAIAGDPNKAFALLEAAHQAAPDDAQVLSDLASLALSVGAFAPSADFARQALRLEPGHVVSLYTLGLALARGGAVSDAIDVLERVVRSPHAGQLELEVGSAVAEVAGLIERLREAAPAMA